MTPVGTALNFRRENENLSSSADVLHKTKNLAISRCCFADDGNEMDKSEKRTCRACKAIVFTSKYANLLRSRCRRRCRCLSSLMTWTVQLDFICINGDMPSGTSHNLCRIGFESLERVNLAIPLSSSVAMWLKVLWHKLP